MSLDRLNNLLQQYLYELATAGDCAVANSTCVSPDVVLLALEEMMGIDAGGCALGDALETWLSQPSSSRNQITFEKIKQDFDQMCKEVDDMIGSTTPKLATFRLG